MGNYRVLLLVLFTLTSGLLQAQILTEDGNLMGEFINYEQNLMPDEDSEGFAVPDTNQLKQWKRMMDLFVAESYSQAEDSLTTNFSNYEMVLLTDTSFSNREYYLIREKSPVTLGWGLFASDANYQRDVIIAVPHPLHDSYTPQEGVNLFQYLGGRLLAMAGTHRCSNDEAAFSDGTTTVCNDTQTSEKYKVSDMAHYDSTAFQIAHESLKEISVNIYAINLHGHANSSCEDVFLSNGRSDDPQTSLQTVRDSLISDGIDAAMTGDGSSCTLAGTTNVQGRYMNGSTNPADDQPVSNTGFFFHVEQSKNIRISLDGHIQLIEAFGDLIPKSESTFTFPDFPSLTINEIHFNPDAINGDANNNGNVGSVSDEFLEIINTADTTIALDQWIIADNSSDRHVIESNTNILPGRALLVFGQDSFDGIFGGSTVQAASTNALSLNNSGDKIYIKTPANDIVTYLEYPGDESGVSITLNPDITGDSLVSHSTADTDDNSLFSPGTKINGDPFLPFITIDGTSGWRMMASPTVNMPIADLTAFNPIQGFGDGYDKNFYTSYNGSSWLSPNSLTDSLDNGSGFIFYFFDNDEAQSTQLPVTIRGTGSVPNTDVTIDLHTSGDKWNLIGNPFDSAIDFSEISATGGSLASSVGYVYDHGIQNYITTTSIGDSVSSWQGIMIENNSAASITIPVSSQIDEATFYKHNSPDQSYLVLELSDIDNNLGDQLVISFSDEAFVEWDKLDMLELPSISSEFIGLAGKGFRNGVEVLQSQFSVPNDLENVLEIPLLITQRINSADKLKLYVKKKVNIPEHISLFISDETSEPATNILSPGFTELELNGARNADSFGLIVQSNLSIHNEFDQKLPNHFELYQNFPNPFNPVTHVNYDLPESSDVQFKAYSITGALVRTITTNHQNPGKFTIRFDATNLSSGIYIYTLKTKFGIKSGKMILLK
ncbi:MAG: lamin tail domain-containing protein [Balneolaceae bacterium]|nr:lamin tail domain-containing protein [Balneolaceae bacterium]MBO6547747.1 lamin tail domain-containing protein [Balneolaceae bacterium]MBO6648258.1 lamin tail domain-containing protein [Balneolaceae bacterium]